MPEPEGWWRIDNPGERPFTAGFRVGAFGRVDHGAPILRWLHGKTIADVRRICRLKQWTLEKLDAADPGR